MMKLKYLLPLLVLSLLHASCNDKVDEVQETEEVIPEPARKDTNSVSVNHGARKREGVFMVDHLSFENERVS